MKLQLNKDQKAIITLITLLFLMFLLRAALNMASASDFWLSGWNHRETLTFNYAVDAGTQITFNITADSLNEQCQSDFDDLRFYSLSGNPLSAYNETTVSSDYITVWLLSDGQLNCYLFYGNDAASNYWDENAVFNRIIADCVLAYPMNEVSGTIVHDVSGSGNNAAFVGTGLEWRSDGWFNNGLSFNGSGYLSMSTFTNLNFSESASLFYYILCDDVTNAGWIFEWACSGGGFAIDRWLFNSFYRIDFRQNEDVWSSAIASGDYMFNVDVVNITDTKHYNYMNASLQGSISDYTPAQKLGLYFWRWGWASAANIKGDMFGIYMVKSALEQDVISDLQVYYPDAEIIEGSLCLRVWVNVMPSVTYGVTSLSNDELLGVIMVFFVLAISISIGLLYARKK